MNTPSSNNQKRFFPGINLSIGQLVALRENASLFSARPRLPLSTHLSGSYRSRFRGRGMDFDEVRHYQPGDDIRSIDWRVTARTQKVHTKIFREEKERPVFICLDQQKPMFFGSRNTLKSVIAAATASVALWSAHTRRDRVGAMLFTETEHLNKKPASSRKTALSILQCIVSNHNAQVDALQNALPEPLLVNRLNENLQRLRNVVYPGSLVYLISDLGAYDEETERHLSMLAQHNDLVVYQINDVLEFELPPQGQYPITNGTTHSSMTINNQKTRQRFAEQRNLQQQRIKQSLEKHRVQYNPLLTTSGQSKKLMDFLLNAQTTLHRRSEYQ